MSIQFPASKSLCNDLAKASEALDGKKVRFLLCFSAGWRSAYLAGGSAFRPFRFGFVVFVCAFDLPTYMTTGVHVDVILTCFFSCKDRASEGYRPHQKKKKKALPAFSLSGPAVPSCLGHCSEQLNVLPGTDVF